MITGTCSRLPYQHPTADGANSWPKQMLALIVGDIIRHCRMSWVPRPLFWLVRRTIGGQQGLLTAGKITRISPTLLDRRQLMFSRSRFWQAIGIWGREMFLIPITAFLPKTEKEMMSCSRQTRMSPGL